MIIWPRVRGKLYTGYVFMAKTFDFGQIHVKEELEYISTLECLGYRQPDYPNWKHISHSEILSDPKFLFQIL